MQIRTVVLLALVVLGSLPLTVAHFTPTSAEQEIIDQITPPDTVNTCATTSAATQLLRVTPGETYYIALGAGRTSGTGSFFIHLVERASNTTSNPPTDTPFRVTNTGTVVSTGSSASTVHLLKHENLTISGTNAAFWGVIEYVPTSGVNYVGLFRDGSGDATPRYVQSFTLSGLKAYAGPFIFSCSGNQVFGRLFNEDHITFTQPSLTVTPALSTGIGAWPAIHPTENLIVLSGDGTGGENARLYYMHSNGTFMEAIRNSTDFVPPIAGSSVRTAWNSDGTKLAVTGSTGSSTSYLRVYNFTGGVENPSFTWTGGNLTTATYSFCSTTWNLDWVNETTFTVNQGTCGGALTRVWYCSPETGACSIQWAVTRGRGYASASSQGFATYDSYTGGSCSAPYVAHMAYDTTTGTWVEWGGTTTPAYPSSSSNCIGQAAWSPNGQYLLVCGVGGSRIYTFNGDNPATANIVAMSDLGGSGSTGGGSTAWSPDSRLAFCNTSTTNVWRGFKLAANETWFDVPTLVFSPATTVNSGGWSYEWLNDGEHFLYLTDSHSVVTYWESSEAFTAPPNAPSDLTAIAGRGTINLTWNAVSGATSYTICRSPASIPTATCSGYAEIATTALTSYSDTNVETGTTYYYRVRSESGDLSGGVSNEASAAAERTFTPIFGDSGSIFAGSKAQTAANFRINETALGVLWGLMLTLSISLAGFLFMRTGLGAGVGGVVGLVISTTVGFFPLWLVAFVAVAFVALYTYAKTRSAGGA